jgi:hypothetical protein
MLVTCSADRDLGIGTARPLHLSRGRRSAGGLGPSHAGGEQMPRPARRTRNGDDRVSRVAAWPEEIRPLARPRSIERSSARERAHRGAWAFVAAVLDDRDMAREISSACVRASRPPVAGDTPRRRWQRPLQEPLMPSE